MPELSSERAGTSITACPNGPLLVRGPFEIIDALTGEATPVRRTVALCRCGVSSIKPYCDGTHKIVESRTEAADHETARAGEATKG